MTNHFREIIACPADTAESDDRDANDEQELRQDRHRWVLRMCKQTVHKMISIKIGRINRKLDQGVPDSSHMRQLNSSAYQRDGEGEEIDDEQ